MATNPFVKSKAFCFLAASLLKICYVNISLDSLEKLISHSSLRDSGKHINKVRFSSS